MTWFKVDDSLHSHPKTMAVSLAAVGLWAVAGSWSSDHLTDGFIPDHMVALLSRGQAELPKELCAAGLWKRTRGGFQFHQWHEDGDGSTRNPSKEEVVSVRQKRAEAGRKGGLASGRTRSKPASKREASAKAGASRIVQPPTRPDPTPIKDGSVGRHLPPVEGARENDDDQSLDMVNDRIEGRIIELLAELTGRTVDRVHASTVRRQLLDDRPVTNPLGYVASCIRGEPKRYLPTNGAPWEAPVPQLPPKDPDAYDHGAAEARKLLTAKLRKEP